MLVRVFFRSIATFAMALFLLPVSQGKELSNRLGIGFSNQFSEDLPSVAARYYPKSDLGLSAALGVDTKEDESKFGFMVRVHRVIFFEDNLNFYMGGGAGLLSIEQPNDSGDIENESGFELSGFAGAEFFFTGLENLGFSMEFGVGVTSIDSETRFRTIGDHPIKAGITFYF